MELGSIQVSLHTWYGLIKQLRIRGNGKMETGAVLLGRRGTNKVIQFICLDELDPNCYVQGGIEFSFKGYIKLSDFCDEHDLTVIGDVHTHPRSWTGMSEIDRTNPFVSRIGHCAIIVPNYAQNWLQLKSGLGIFTYLGNYSWKKSYKTFKISLL